jgi:hypothetical protein
MHSRQHHRDAAPDGMLLIRPGSSHRGHVPCLDPEVEFFPHRGGKSAGQADCADRTRPASAALEPDRQAQQDVQVLFHGGADPRALNLYSYLGIRVDVAAQPGLVDLCDRRGRGRFRPQL